MHQTAKKGGLRINLNADATAGTNSLVVVSARTSNTIAGLQASSPSVGVSEAIR